MGFYDSEEGVEEYIRMAEGYDGGELIERLSLYLEERSSVLEIGMGPGVDLKLLNRHYRATGSDNSEVFIRRYLKENPEADVLSENRKRPGGSG